MQSLSSLPEASKILTYLREECSTKDIDVKITAKIATLIQYRLFDQTAIEESIRNSDISVTAEQTTFISNALSRYILGKSPQHSPLNSQIPKTSLSILSSSLDSLLITSSKSTIDTTAVKTSSVEKPYGEKSIDKSYFYGSAGNRIGDLDQLCDNLIEQMTKYELFAEREDVKRFMDFDNWIKYFFGNSIICFVQNPVKKTLSLIVEDLPEDALINLQALLSSANLMVLSTTVQYSSQEEHPYRVKKELVNLSYYSYVEYHWLPGDEGGGEYSGYLVEWDKIQHKPLDELHTLLPKNNGRVNWRDLEPEKLSEPFIRVFSDQVNWFRIAKMQDTLSENFKVEYAEKLAGQQPKVSSLTAT